jgi:lipid A 4'-phosphatase
VSDPALRVSTIWIVALLILSGAVFTLWPDVDLWVSAQFWSAEDGFWIAKIAWLQVLRDVLWKAMVVVFLVSVVAWPLSGLWRPVLWIPARAWAFSALLFLIGPGLVVNAILKAFWGRARPAHVTEFGGEKTFTPALQITDQCANDCSFVSGEGSGAVALALVTLVLTAAMRGKRAARAIRWVIWPLAFVGLSMRIMMGRHFLSDSVFAALIVAAIALILVRVTRCDTTRAGQ